jgi:hypothetical protein
MCSLFDCVDGTDTPTTRPAPSSGRDAPQGCRFRRGYSPTTAVLALIELDTWRVLGRALNLVDVEGGYLVRTQAPASSATTSNSCSRPSAGKVSLDFTDYQPGTYRFAAINSDDDSVTNEIEQDFTPNLQLVEWKTATETGAHTPENEVGIASPVLTVENTGTAPDQLNWVGYESETYTAEWYPPGEEDETTSIPHAWSPESQQEYLSKPPSFNSGVEVPVTLQPGESRQFVEKTGVLSIGLRSPNSYDFQDEETAGWAVQEGLEYNVTITIATKYSGLNSKTKTVVWKQVAEVESLEEQPESASIVTKDSKNSSS